MKYIYCPSYPAIRLVCYFITQNEPITIITSNLDILKLCKVMQWPVITFNSTIKNRPRVYEIWNPIKIREFRKKIDEIFLEISNQCQKDSQLYFSMLCFDLLGLDLIARFTRKRADLKIIYWRENISCISKRVFPPNIRKLAQLIYFNLLHQLSFQYQKCQSDEFIAVNDNFLSQHNITELILPNIYDIDVFNNLIIPQMPAPIIILGGYSLEMDAITYNTEDLKGIYHFIKELRPDVYYKPHPGCEKIEIFFESYNIFPAYIPSEFLAKSTKIVISTATTAMNYLAKSGVTCISILDLIQTKQSFDKEGWRKKMLTESANQIKFVESKEALERYLLK